MNKGLMDAPKASAANSRLAHQLIQLGGRQSTVLVLVEVVEKRTQPCISAASRRHNQQYSRVLTASSGHRLAGLLAVSAIASGPAPKCTG
jgi:mannose-1-phosphate guanylyltransferase